MEASRIQKIIIAGNGMSAWMAAAAISSAIQGQRVEISVIGETPASANHVESSLPISLAFNRRLGIDERDLMRKTSASFTLGTQFNDWPAPGNQYFLPIAPHGASIEYVHFHNYAIKARLAGDTTPFNDYSLSAVAARLGKFAHPVMEHDSIFSTIAYGHHFESKAYTDYMRSYAQAHGAVAINDPIVGVQRRSDDGPDNGFIQSVSLASGETLSADFFVDCSGAGALLSDKQSPIEDWSEWLPANRMISATTSPGTPDPYSEITALDVGWHLRVPARETVEHRLVYCDKHLDDEEARNALVSCAGEDTLSSFDVCEFRQGRRTAPWSKNCVALGAAAGAVEPLGGARLAMIHSGLLRLVSMFPDTDCNPLLAEEFNRLSCLEADHIRDFVLSHYQSASRQDAPFWSHSRNTDLPPTLEHKMKLFMAQGQVALYEEESFPDTTWVSACLGQGQWPTDYDPMLENYDFERLAGRFDQMKQIIQQAAGAMPSHGDYLQQI